MLFFDSAEDIARLERIWLSNKPNYSESKSTNKLTKTKIIKETHQQIDYNIDKKDKLYDRDFYEDKRECLESLENKSRYLNDKSYYLDSPKFKSDYLGSLKNLKNHCNESKDFLQCHHRSY